MGTGGNGQDFLWLLIKDTTESSQGVMLTFWSLKNDFADQSSALIQFM